MGQRKSKLCPSDLGHLVKCTKFTEQEVQAWYHSFMRDCPTGKLTLEEFTNLYRDIFFNVDPTGYAKRVFRTFDTDRNGTIDFREFMCAISITSRGSFEDKLRWTFNMYDTDTDGSISLQEMEDMIGAVYKLIGNDIMAKLLPDRLTPTQRARSIFLCMDKDNNDNVTFDEFQSVTLKDPNMILLFQVGKNNPITEIRK